ncbi:MAG TPA: radical SAM protein, partial [Micromonospora sp.]
LVVDTDGSLEQVDTLRSAYHGASGTDLNVHRDAFDVALRHPAVVARQVGAEALGSTCRRCPIHRVCGGGYSPHRYREGSGFRHRSVYCPDLTLLIGHIRDRLRREVAGLRAARR